MISPKNSLDEQQNKEKQVCFPNTGYSFWKQSFKVDRPWCLSESLCTKSLIECLTDPIFLRGSFEAQHILCKKTVHEIVKNIPLLCSSFSELAEVG